jgi:hypothetical protein
MYACRKVLSIQINIITGEKIKILTPDPYESNKDNKCEFFHKRLFAPKEDKLLCVHCTYWSEADIAD